MAEFDYLKRNGTPLLWLYQLSYSHPSLIVRRAATCLLVRGGIAVDFSDVEVASALDNIGLPHTKSFDRNCRVYTCPGAKFCYNDEDFFGKGKLQ